MAPTDAGAGGPDGAGGPPAGRVVSTGPPGRRSVRSPTERERLAEAVAAHLDTPVSVLGVVFVLVVLTDTTADPQGSLATALNVVSWVLWAVFVAEFVLRLVIAPSTGAFLRRNWWQVVFLAVPFLRFLRVLRLVRVGRLARVVRVVSSAVRTTRSARRALTGRLAWMASLTAIVVLVASQVLYLLEVFDTYGEALAAAALATVAGEPLPPDTAVARTASVALALYSVVVFASLAGSIGAYFVQRRGPGEGEGWAGGSASAGSSGEARRS